MLSEAEAYLLPPLALAYVGDAVWELHVRTNLVLQGGRRPAKLHQAAVASVRATAQADSLRQLTAILTDRERDVIRRGRNAKGSVPRHAKVTDYRASTGFEALLGYLYLMGDEARVQEIVRLLLE